MAMAWKPGDVPRYDLFTRKWWEYNGEMHCGPKRFIAYFLTEYEAYRMQQYYNEKHKPWEQKRRVEYEPNEPHRIPVKVPE
jgi:hypothetical protein